MGFFNEFPHTRTYDNDLGWLIKKVKDLDIQLQNFIKLNTVKYADPIQWDISTQYEANTVVIDALTGVAYISTQPVPSGVNINNTDYWTPVFTLDLVNLNKNITLRNDGDNHNATFPSVVGDWVIVGGQLYRVTQDIGVHTAYVVGFNIEIYTVELFVKDYLNQVLIMIGDLQDLDTEDKTSVVNAINEVIENIGDLQDLDTEDKTSVVDAINSVLSDLNDLTDDFNDYKVYVTPEEFGAAGDGVTDDTIAINNAITTGLPVIMKNSYLISNSLVLDGVKKVINNGTITCTGQFVIDLSGSFNVFKSTGIITCLNFLTCTSDSSFNIIKYGMVYITDKYGLKVDLSTGGFTHNSIKGHRISGSGSSNNPKGYYLHTSGNAYINENTFEKAALYRVDEAVYIYSESSSPSNNNVFRDVDPEGSNAGIHLKGLVVNNYFYNFRNDEMDDVTLLNIENAYYNHFYFSKPAKAATLNSNSLTFPCYIYTGIASSSGTTYWSVPVAIKYDNGLCLYPLSKIPDQRVVMTTSKYFNYTSSGANQFHQYTIFDYQTSVKYILGLDNAYGVDRIGSIQIIWHVGNPFPRINIGATEILNINDIADDDYLVTVIFTDSTPILVKQPYLS